MKKVEGYGIVQWQCPYKSCLKHNEEEYHWAEMADYEKDPLRCTHCDRKVRVTVV